MVNKKVLRMKAIEFGKDLLGAFILFIMVYILIWTAINQL